MKNTHRKFVSSIKSQKYRVFFLLTFEIQKETKKAQRKNSMELLMKLEHGDTTKHAH